MKRHPKSERPPWDQIRGRIDLAALATSLLGPSPKRSGRRLLWRCPFHDDRSPSFQVDPQSQRWKCWPCDRGGDAAALLMQLEGIGFAEAVGRLAIRSGWVARASPTPREPAPKNPNPPPTSPSGLSAEDAAALVEAALRTLDEAQGARGREYLLDERGLSWETVRRHRLGWTPGVTLPTSRADRFFRVSGVVIPWFDGDRLRRVKIRRLDGDHARRYIQAFDDRPTVYPGPEAIRAESPLVVVEGEFEAMLLGQELDGVAAVATVGGASAKPDRDSRRLAARCRPRFAAHDADESGDRAATSWGPGLHRVRPPAGKDWTDAKKAGIDLRRWWVENHFPSQEARDERAAIMEFDGGLAREVAEQAACSLP